MATFNTISGDLIALARGGSFNAIAHGCNCFHTMGDGIAKQIAEFYPSARIADCMNHARGARGALGRFGAFLSERNCGFYIFNLYTQYSTGKPRVDGEDTYEARLNAIESSFRMMCKFLKEADPNKTWHIGIPLIGAGLAGGNWEDIFQRIKAATNDFDYMITVVEYKP